MYNLQKFRFPEHEPMENKRAVLQLNDCITNGRFEIITKTKQEKKEEDNSR